MAPLNLATGPTSITVKVQPVVLLNICDAYIRRNKNQKRVIGTLLGTIADGVVEIRNCYAVPHNETSEQVEVDIPHHHTLRELHQKVNQKEVVVGWYSTGTGVSGSDALIQEFYSNECQNPVHLTVDTILQNETLSVEAYVSRILAIGNKALATEFQAVDCEVRTLELEKVGAEVLSNTSEKPSGDLDQLALSVSRLQEALDRVYSYVDAVVSGQTKGVAATGRFLADTVTSVPHIGADELERLVADNAQDALLIMYLANLVRAQLALADRLGTAALPLL